MDDVLADSFPASDPPSWTAGVARPAPVAAGVIPLLRPGELVPHFTVTTLDGARFAYVDIWQRRDLVLVSVPPTESAAGTAYVARLAERMREVAARRAACVGTLASIAGVPSPGVIVADRWGEIHHVAAAARVEDLPDPDAVVEWLDYIERQCPECEGEAR